MIAGGSVTGATGGEPRRGKVDLSVVVVNYNAGEILRSCLRALVAEVGDLSVELFLVDNASTDGSFDPAVALASELSASAAGGALQLHVVRHGENVGFARGSNAGLRAATGRYLLLLNPDALVGPGSLAEILGYMDRQPEVGICGPRILLPNGQLDSPCRRSFKTPAIYFYKLLGLSKLFPRSRRFGQYYLSYLPEDQLTEVDAVIGAFLMVRREVVERVGLLDEGFFMYCEDEDWCFRARQAGWKVVYNPLAGVTHHKGTSAKKRRARMVLEWHRSIWQFHRKNMAPSYSGLVNWVVYAGMAGSLVSSLLLSGANELAAPGADGGREKRVINEGEGVIDK